MYFKKNGTVQQKKLLFGHVDGVQIDPNFT